MWTKPILLKWQVWHGKAIIGLHWIIETSFIKASYTVFLGSLHCIAYSASQNCICLSLPPQWSPFPEIACLASSDVRMGWRVSLGTMCVTNGLTAMTSVMKWIVVSEIASSFVSEIRLTPTKCILMSCITFIFYILNIYFFRKIFFYFMAVKHINWIHCIGYFFSFNNM